MRRLAPLLALAVAGCGSQAARDLPAPPGGIRPVTVRASGALRATLDPQARTVTLVDGARRVGVQPAGAGPTGVASNDLFRVYVADAATDGLLVYRLRPTFQLERRLRLRGEPWGVAADPPRHRLYVTLRARDLVVQLPLHGRPHVLAAFATPPGPQAVRVTPTGTLVVTGRGGATARIDPSTAPRIR